MQILGIQRVIVLWAISCLWSQYIGPAKLFGGYGSIIECNLISNLSCQVISRVVNVRHRLKKQFLVKLWSTACATLFSDYRKDSIKKIIIINIRKYWLKLQTMTSVRMAILSSNITLQKSWPSFMSLKFIDTSISKLACDSWWSSWKTVTKSVRSL